MRVGVHVDQLFSRVPGGIGTYIRELVPALAEAEPSLEVVAFHARFPGTTAEPWLRELRVEEIPARIRTLYPGWDLLGRPSGRSTSSTRRTPPRSPRSGGGSGSW